MSLPRNYILFAFTTLFFLLVAAVSAECAGSDPRAGEIGAVGAVGAAADRAAGTDDYLYSDQRAVPNKFADSVFCGVDGAPGGVSRGEAAGEQQQYYGRDVAGDGGRLFKAADTGRAAFGGDFGRTG